MGNSTGSTMYMFGAVIVIYIVVVKFVKNLHFMLLARDRILLRKWDL